MQVKSFFGKEQVPLVTARSLFSQHGILLYYANGIPDYDSSTVYRFLFFVLFILKRNFQSFMGQIYVSLKQFYHF